MTNFDGGSLLRGEPQPIPDYREPRLTPEELERLRSAKADEQLDYRLARNNCLMAFGDTEESLSSTVAQLLRINRELAMRLYGRPVDLDGVPQTAMFINT